MTMTCCGKYWNSPIITNIVKSENMITADRSENYDMKRWDSQQRSFSQGSSIDSAKVDSNLTLCLHK